MLSNVRKRLYMWCDYCSNYHAETKKVYRHEVEEYVDLCPDCASEDTLELCDCGNLATHDGHRYCSDCD